MLSHTYDPELPLYKQGYCSDECKINHAKGVVFSTLYFSKLQDIYQHITEREEKRKNEN